MNSGSQVCNEQRLTKKNATTEERYNARLEQAKPVLDAMFAWANPGTAAPKTPLGKALTYLKNRWPHPTNYLKDGRLEISNNRVKPSISPSSLTEKTFSSPTHRREPRAMPSCSA